MKKIIGILTILSLLPIVTANVTFVEPNISSYQGFFDYGNAVTDNMFMNVMVMVLWVVIFMSLSVYEPEKAFATASFICLIISSLLRIASLVNEYLIILFLLATAFSVIALRKKT